MERVSVESSNLSAIGYDDESQVLEVEFRRGAVYRYFEVERVAYENLLKAESVGKAFNAIIKGGGYSYRRVEQ